MNELRAEAEDHPLNIALTPTFVESWLICGAMVSIWLFAMATGFGPVINANC
ncbi:MAG: hypothetical protein L3J30_00875 [Marinosulfonomonas sp.]|nr:hypothetical protein [Marinosulfonomonas sp.]